jgi:hypothetical protein
VVAQSLSAAQAVVQAQVLLVRAQRWPAGQLSPWGRQATQAPALWSQRGVAAAQSPSTAQPHVAAAQADARSALSIVESGGAPHAESVSADSAARIPAQRDVGRYPV